MKFSNIVIVGASGGIGWSLLMRVLKKNPNARIYASYHRSKIALQEELSKLDAVDRERIHIVPMNVREESSIQNFFAEVSKITPQIDLLISTVGVLHGNGIFPEKSSRDLKPVSLTAQFEINALSAAIIFKHAKKLLERKNPAVLAFLSAKVGSISDNRSGGWYGYRATKAALNMFVRTMALELKQSQYRAKVLAIHPGTTVTELSKPFSAKVKHKVWATEQTAEHIFDLIQTADQYETGSFMNWDGSRLPW